MNQTRQRSKNITDEDIEITVRVLDGWEGKLSWESLIDELGFKTKKHYTRQALSKHTRIKSAFTDTKKRLSNHGQVQISGKMKSANYLSQKNELLVSENKRLKRENEQILQQFTRWAYNAYIKGLTIDDLNKKLPPLDRGQEE